MVSIHASDIGWTGSESTRAFQMLSDGNIGQLVTSGSLSLGVEAITVSATVTVFVGELAVATGGVEGALQADSKTDTIRMMLLFTSHLRH